MTIAYCGLDCSKCIGFIATKSGDKNELAKVAKIWSAQFNADVRPEHVVCDGCRSSGRKSYHCKHQCKIPTCCIDNNITSCIECKVYPCADLSFILEHTPEAKSNLEKLVTK